MTEIVPGVFVGGWSAARDHGRRFDTVVNCAVDAPDFGSHRKFDLVDGPGNNPKTMESAIEFVAEEIRRKHRILVHCVAGRSRSVTVVSAAISRVRGVPMDYVLRRTARKRGCEGPNQPHPALVELAATNGS